MTAVLELLRFAVAGAVLIAPGVFATSALFPQKSVRERWILGSVVGFAAAVYLAIALAYIRLWLFYPAWLIVALGSALACRRLRPRPRLFVRPSGRDWLLILVLVLVAISRVAVALRNEFPPGWDPSFHMILARKLATAGRMIFDWRPFEDIALNYPLGSHACTVVLSQMTALPLHVVFRLLIPTLGILTTAVVYAFASKVTDNDDVAIPAALTYGLWAVYGSIDYYRWGGLPNLLGMVLLVGILLLLLDARTSRRHTLLVGLLFTAIFFTHHHVMIASGSILAGLFVFFIVAQPTTGCHRVIAWGLAGSVVLGGFYIVPYALKAATLGHTGVLTFSEVFYDLETTVSSVGVVFFVVSLSGLVLHRFGMRPPAQIGVLYVAGGTLLALFVFFEYGWRALSPHIYGEPYVAFTPSRFLTDLVYFASVFAGYALFQLQRSLKVPFVAVVLAAIAMSMTNRTAWAKAAVPTGPPELIAAYRWIDAHTPPDTLVLADSPWAVYTTWRRCSVTPIPISEPSTADTPKARLFEAIGRGEYPREISGTQIVAVTRPGGPVRPGRLLWRTASGFAVVDVTPEGPWR